MNTSVPVSQHHSFALAVPPLALLLLASGLAWTLLCIALPPVNQNFPLNDDWAFGRGAFLFSRGEGIDYGNWASMPQLGQWLWACPFVWLLGESFFALRVSTIVVSWLGLWAFYDLLRQQELSPARAALATAVLAFNPLFFLLQGTFMTDVPALSMSLAALALYVRALRHQGAGWLAGACLVATLAAISRQNTVAVSLTALVLLWRERELRGRLLWWLGVLLPAVAAVAVHLWFQRRSDVRATKLVLLSPAPLLQLPFVAVHFCGLSALPLLLRNPRTGPWKTYLAAAGVMLACAGYWLLYGKYLPYGGLSPYTDNMLTPYGAFAGSRLGGGLFVVGERPLLLGTAARVFLSLLGCAAGAALVTRVIQQGNTESRLSPLLLFTLFQVPFLLIVPAIYDRYLLFLLPGALALAARPIEEGEPAQRRWVLSSLAALVALGIVSVGLMHDWLSWNAARWELGRRAVARHIKPQDIEGGVEWDGWYAPVGKAPGRSEHPKWPVLPFTKDWFPSITGRYALSFSELRGARRVDAEPYSLWLPPGPRRFFLLELPPLPPGPAESRGRSSPR